jgi:phage-related protein
MFVLTSRDVSRVHTYRLYPDAVLILAVFEKKTSKTPKYVIDVCKSRLKGYEQDIN